MRARSFCVSEFRSKIQASKKRSGGKISAFSRLVIHTSILVKGTGHGRRKCGIASELLETRRHGLVLVCFARLALAPSPIVLADAAPSALLACAPSPSVLADAPPSAFLAKALLPIVLIKAWN